MSNAADVETSTAEYARRFSGSVGAWFLDVQASATLDLAAPWRGGTALDVGGGHGQLTGPLVEAGFDVTVAGSARSCRERVAPWVDSGRARFAEADLLRLPWPARSFDVVLAFRLLPHVARWPDLVSELCRVARQAVIVDYPTRRSVNTFAGVLFSLKRRVESDTRPFLVFRDEDVARSLSASGFAVTGRRTQFFFPMALHRGLGSAALSRASERVARTLGLTRALGSPVIVRGTRRA